MTTLQMERIQMERVSTEQLQKERQTLLCEVGLTWEQLKERLMSGEYSAAERDVAERIENIDYLLSGE